MCYGYFRINCLVVEIFVDLYAFMMIAILFDSDNVSH